MPRRSTTNRLAKAEEQFKAAVTTYLDSLGARPGHFYDFEMDTPAGLLHVTVYGTWVATRFEDVKRGIAITKECGYSCNQYSGKWNFHFGDGTTASLDPGRAVLSLSYYLDTLLTWEVAAA